MPQQHGIGGQREDCAAIGRQPDLRIGLADRERPALVRRQIRELQLAAGGDVRGERGRQRGERRELLAALQLDVVRRPRLQLAARDDEQVALPRQRPGRDRRIDVQHAALRIGGRAAPQRAVVAGGRDEAVGGRGEPRAARVRQQRGLALSVVEADLGRRRDHVALRIDQRAGGDVAVEIADVAGRDDPRVVLAVDDERALAIGRDARDAGERADRRARASDEIEPLARLVERGEQRRIARHQRGTRRGIGEVLRLDLVEVPHEHDVIGRGRHVRRRR